VPYKERPPERAFLNIVSIIEKVSIDERFDRLWLTLSRLQFPWAEKELWTEATRDAIFDCAFGGSPFSEHPFITFN
jgi:hypothetical protein